MHRLVDAVRAGESTPTNDEAPGSPQTRGPEDKNTHPNSRTVNADCETRDERRIEWEAYRAHCFIRSTVAPVWWWAAAHEFDFVLVGLSLADALDARIDLGTHAVDLIVFDEHHVVPIGRLTPTSLAHLQSLSAESFHERAAQRRAEQLDAERVLREALHMRVLFKAAPGSVNDTVQ